MTHGALLARSSAVLVALAIVLAGCRQLGLHDRPPKVARESVVTSTGVHYTDTFLGRGRAAGPGDEVVLDYTLWLVNGERIDSTLDRGVPLTVALGTSELPGLDDGLVSIQPDGRRKIVVPARLAYGSTGVEGLIPPDSDLVFEVHAIEVRAARP